MSRNFYPGAKKRRVALLNADGDLEALQKGGHTIELRGTTTMTSGRAVVSGTAIKSTSFVLTSPHHGGPTALSWDAFDGYVIVSGTGNGVVGYQIII